MTQSARRQRGREEERMRKRKCVQSHFLLLTRAINMLDVYQWWAGGWAGCVHACVCVSSANNSPRTPVDMNQDTREFLQLSTSNQVVAARQQPPLFFLFSTLHPFFLWHSPLTHIYSVHLTHTLPPPPLPPSCPLLYFNNIYGWMI